MADERFIRDPAEHFVVETTPQGAVKQALSGANGPDGWRSGA
jgi:hypothetical protein